MLSDDDKKALLAGLKSGLGLTKSAEIIGIDAKAMTAIIQKDPELKTEMLESIQYAAKMLMVLSSDYIGKKQFAKWKDNTQFIKHFVSRLVLWEEFCRFVEVNEGKFIEAVMTYRDSREAATAMGMTLDQFNRYLIRSARIQQMITDLNIVMT